MVVLPASMWAMIPMFRVRASGYSRISKTFPAFPLTSCSVCATCFVSLVCLWRLFWHLLRGTRHLDDPPVMRNRPLEAGSTILFDHHR